MAKDFISKDFEKSLLFLTHHKQIIIPIVAMIILPLLIFSIFFNVTGISTLIKDSIKSVGSYENYSEMMKNNPVIVQMLKEKIITFKNMVLLLILLIVEFIGQMYLSAMALAIISKNFHKSKDSIFTETNKFFAKLLSLKLLFALIVVASIIVWFVLFLIISYFGLIISQLLAYILILMVVAYLFYLSFRFFYSTPSLVLDDTTVTKSISQSFHLSKKHFSQVIIVFLLLLGISIILNNIIINPINNAYRNTIFENDLYKIVLNIVIIGIFILIESITISFEHVFHFFTYVDIKKLRK